MRFGLRRPSLGRMIGARTSPKRFIAHSLGVKMPRGYGFLRSPKKAAYNKVYHKATFSFGDMFKVFFK